MFNICLIIRHKHRKLKGGPTNLGTPLSLQNYLPLNFAVKRKMPTGAYFLLDAEKTFPTKKIFLQYRQIFFNSVSRFIQLTQ